MKLRCRAWNFSFRIPPLPLYETTEEVCLLTLLLQNFFHFVQTEFGSQFNLCSHSPSVHIFSLISLLNPTSVSQSVSLWHLLSSNLTDSYQKTAFIISPYSLCKLFANAESSSSIKCSGALTLPGKSFPWRGIISATQAKWANHYLKVKAAFEIK